MKKILLALCILLSVLTVTAQTPSGKAPVGSATLTQWNKGVQLADSGYQFTNFVDTFALNRGWLKGIAGLLVRVADTTFYVRNNAMTKWVRVGGSGSGGTTDSTIFITHTVLNDSIVALNTRLADTSALLRNLINTFASDTTLIGDVIGGLRSNTVTGLRGKSLPSLSAGYLMYNGTSWVMATVTGGITALTGDITASGTGSVVATLPNVNSTPGIFGTAAVVPAVTVNAKGLTTGIVADSIQITEPHVTGLVSDLANKLAIGATASGDLSGTYPGPEVVGLLGQGLPSLSNGYLVYSSMSGWQLNNITPITNLTGDVTSVGNATTYAGIVPVNKGGTGTATPSLVQGTGVTITGSFPNQTINASGTDTTILAGINIIQNLSGKVKTLSADTTTGNSKLATQAYVQNHSGGSGTDTTILAGIDLTQNLSGKVKTINADTTTGNTKLATQGFVTRQSFGTDTTINITSVTPSITGKVKTFTIPFNAITGVKVRAGTNTTVSVGTDSSYTVNATGGGGLDTTKIIQPINYGILYNKNSWTSGADFVTLGTGVAPSFTGNKLVFAGTGSGGSLTNGYGVSVINGTSNYQTCLERFSFTVREIIGTITSNSYGVPISLFSTNTSYASNLHCMVDLSTDATRGKLIIYAGNSNTLVATSTTALTITAADALIETVERKLNTILFTVLDVNTKQSITITYTYNLFYQASPVALPNTSYFALDNANGSGSTTTVDSIIISSQERIGATIITVGDSKFAGYGAGSTIYNCIPKLLGQYYSVCNLSGPGDKTQDVLNRLPEILALSGNSKYIFLSIGCNDIRYSVPSGTYQANYDTIAARISRAGKILVNMLPFYEPALNQTALTSFIQSTFPNNVDPRIEFYRNSDMLITDSIHLTPYADTVSTRAAITSFNFKYELPFDNLPPSTSTGTSTGWSKGGDVLGTGSNVLGTLDNRSMYLVVNSTPVIFIDSIAGLPIGIGTITPTGTVDIKNTSSTLPQLVIENTSTTFGAEGYLQNNLNYFATFGKLGGSFNPNGLLNPNDQYFYNDTHGNLDFQQTNTTGKIQFAVGTSSTPDVVIDSAHKLNVGSLRGFQVDVNGNVIKINGVTTSFPSSNTKGALTNNGSGTLSYQIAPSVVASNYIAAQTTAQTITSVTSAAADTSYQINAYVNVTALSASILTTFVTYTPEGSSTPETFTFYPQGSTSTNVVAVSTGAINYPPVFIRCKASTSITLGTTVTGGTITYNTKGSIILIP